MLLLGMKNTASQTVLANGTITLGSVYRRYCKRTCAGLPTFAANGNSITLNGEGIYHITAKIVGSGTAAGVLTAQMTANNEAVAGAFASETITTADTELRTLVIDEYIMVDKTCVLGNSAVASKTIAFLNSGVASTLTSVVVNIDKVV